MLREERITGLDKVRDEIEVYNSLIPEPGELSATLLLEIEDQADLRAELLKFLGVDEAVFLKVEDKDTIRARFEEGRSREIRSARASTCGSRWKRVEQVFN